MARRPSSTAALLLLLVLSLLSVAHCRPLEADPATDTESAAAVATGDDENGPPNPTLPAEVVLPAEKQQQQHGFLRLPSHRLHRQHRPCRHGLFQRQLWWAGHHGAVGEDAPRRFHRHGEALSHSHLLIVSPAAETREVKAVAEPDTDRSLPDGDGVEGVGASREPSFHFHHHGMRLHHHDDHDEEEEKHATKKRFRRADEHHDDSDSEDEDEEVEELVRRFRKAIMRRRSGSGHGRRFHHHHQHYYGHHRHAEEAENKADAAQEEGGVVSWIKDLIMNRF